MKKSVVQVLLCMVIAALMFAMVACGETDGNQNVTQCADGKHVDKDADGKCDVCGKSVQKDGWEKVTNLDNKEMYTKFLLGFTNVAYELSKDKVKEKKQVTIDGSGALKLNENSFFVAVKGKYDGQNASEIREKTILAVDVANNEKINDASRLFSAHLYRDDLYLAIGDNKVQFDVVEGSWTQYYPYSMEKPTSQSLNGLAGMLSSLVKLKDDPTALTRRNSNKLEYQYSLNVDLKGSLTNIFADGLKQLKVSDVQMNKIKSLTASIFGITVEQLDKGEIPDSSVSLTFMISGEKIQNIKANAEIDMSHSDKVLIDADKLNLSLEINELKITNDYAQGVKIDFVNDKQELDTYKPYSDAVYALNVPIKVKDATGDEPTYNNYEFSATMRIFQDNGKDNFIFMEYHDKANEKIDRALYVYDDAAYIVKNVDGQEKCIYQMGVNLSDLASRIVANNLNGSAKMDIYKLISYFFRSLAISETEIKLRVDETFFTDVWYNFDDMLQYIEGLDETTALLEIEEVKEFIDFLRTNSIYFSFRYDNSDLLKIIGSNDSGIAKKVEKIKAYKAENPETDKGEETQSKEIESTENEDGKDEQTETQNG